jgi:hypothetical protein
VQFGREIMTSIASDSFPTLKMEAVGSLDILVPICHPARGEIHGGQDLNNPHRQKLQISYYIVR